MNLVIELKCASNLPCKHCQGRHHSLLHQDSARPPLEEVKVESPPELPPSSSGPAVSSPVVANSVAVSSGGKVILQTVPAILCGSNGCSKVVRCFFDPGSQTSFVRQSVIDELGLDEKSVKIAVSVFGGEATKSTLRKRIALTVAPIDKSGQPQGIEALTKPVICRPAEAVDIHPSRWSHLRNIVFPEEFPREEQEIDVLIGLDFYYYFVSRDIVRGGSSEPVAVRTTLGWVFCGPTGGHDQECTVSRNVQINVEEQLNETLQKFWDLESVGVRPAESSISTTHAEDVVLKKFKETLTWASRVYLPHHAIIREDKQTTKTRVVFDASAKDSNGVSLNSCLEPGPALQPDLVGILLRFRKNVVGIMGDIEKMFLQTRLKEEDRDSHRYLWRDLDPQATLKIYRMTRVTFGVVSSPFLAIGTIQEHVKSCKETFPVASSEILRNTYKLSELEQLQIPRCYTDLPLSQNPKVELHAFGDASEVAYASAVYLRVVGEDGKPHCLLDDNSSTLHWIRGAASQWKPFVANRVIEIQSFLDPSVWRYCPGLQNPADLPTQGLPASQLRASPLWWKGPSWLQESEKDWPEDLRSKPSSEIVDPERKSKASVSCVVQPKEPFIDFTRFSKYSRLLRTVAWIRRFVSNSRVKEEERIDSPLTGLEIQNAEEWLISHVQEESFTEEIASCKQHGPLKDSNLANLNPFMYSQGEWNEHKVELCLWAHVTGLKYAPELFNKETLSKRNIDTNDEERLKGSKKMKLVYFCALYVTSK
ncbi:hypothetical protein ACROYT_G037576 [Oculina patagonica]